jgi:hypothetical protein
VEPDPFIGERSVRVGDTEPSLGGKASGCRPAIAVYCLPTAVGRPATARSRGRRALARRQRAVARRAPTVTSPMSCCSWPTHGGSLPGDSPFVGGYGLRSPMHRRGWPMNDGGSSTNAKIDRPMTISSEIVTPPLARWRFARPVLRAGPRPLAGTRCTGQNKGRSGSKGFPLRHNSSLRVGRRPCPMGSWTRPQRTAIRLFD